MNALPGLGDYHPTWRNLNGRYYTARDCADWTPINDRGISGYSATRAKMVAAVHEYAGLNGDGKGQITYGGLVVDGRLLIQAIGTVNDDGEVTVIVSELPPPRRQR